MSKLTDEQIKDCLDAADQMYCLRDGDKEIFKARAIEAAAIESAATEPLLQRIAELESENEVLNSLMRSGEQRGVAKGLEESKAQITELERQLEEAREDVERMDFVETQGNGMKWLARNSATGRGYRLHNDPDGIYISARAAIDAAMQKGQS